MQVNQQTTVHHLQLFSTPTHQLKLILKKIHEQIQINFELIELFQGFCIKKYQAPYKKCEKIVQNAGGINKIVQLMQIPSNYIYNETNKTIIFKIPQLSDNYPYVSLEQTPIDIKEVVNTIIQIKKQQQNLRTLLSYQVMPTILQRHLNQRKKPQFKEYLLRKSIVWVLLVFTVFLIFSINYNLQQQNTISQLKALMSESLQQINLLTQVNKVQDLSLDTLLYPVDPRSAYFQEFKIKNNQIEYVGDTYAQILGSLPISRKNNNKFTILKAQNKFIRFGIIDRKYKNDRNSYDKKHCISYAVSSGDVWAENKWQGNGKSSEIGQTLQMIVQGSTISWKVSNKIRNEYTNQIISNNSIQWVPFVLMTNKNQRIRWQ